MAKSRRVSRKGGRKGSRKLGLFGRVYSPVNHLFQAAENSVNALTRGTGKIVHTGLNSVNKVGKSVVSHADKAVVGVVRGKSRKNRRSNRKSRRASRR